MAWKKGQSGNPKGRPKGINTIAYEIEKLMKEPCPFGEEKITNKAAIAAVLNRRANKGDLQAIKLMMEYTCQKPATEVYAQVSGDLNVVVISPPGEDDSGLSEDK